MGCASSVPCTNRKKKENFLEATPEVFKDMTDCLMIDGRVSEKCPKSVCRGAEAALVSRHA